MGLDSRATAYVMYKMELSRPKDFPVVGAVARLALQQVTSEEQEVRCDH